MSPTLMRLLIFILKEKVTNSDINKSQAHENQQWKSSPATKSTCLLL